MLAALNEELLDKWLAMYLETHPQYQGQAISTEVFQEWKKNLVDAIEVE